MESLLGATRWRCPTRKTRSCKTTSISERDLQRQEEMHESRLAALENAMEDVKGNFNRLKGTAGAAAMKSGQSEAAQAGREFHQRDCQAAA